MGEEDEEVEDRDQENEDVAVDDEAQEDQPDREERLENAENQKISSEKMNSSVHRLHVEFDDLSVVDEEDELKKDRERRDAISSEEKERSPRSPSTPGLIRIDRGGYQCFQSNYGSSAASASGYPHYPDCPFVFPNPSEPGPSEILPIDRMLLTPCPGIYDEENLRNSHLTYGTPVGWQSSVFPSAAVFPGTEGFAQASAMCLPSLFVANRSDQSSSAASTARATSVPGGPQIDESASSTRLANLTDVNAPILSSLAQRRNVLLKQPTAFYRETLIPVRGTETPASAEASIRNGWDSGQTGSAAVEGRTTLRQTDNHKSRREARRDTSDGAESVLEPEGIRRFEDSTSSTTVTVSDRPKHFFAPLPAKIQHSRQNSNDKTPGQSSTNPNDSALVGFFETYGRGRSSSSDRTNSTVVSARHLQHTLTSGSNVADGVEKGSADICVSGAIPVRPNDHQDRPTSDRGSYKSSENLLIEINRDYENSRGGSSSRQSSNNPLVKSLSCQDLTSETLQSSLFDIGRTFNGEKSQKFAKSDNTLDNPVAVAPKPFRSQLNVTLKCPVSRDKRRDSPDTPEIPKLPTIDYRLFSNPFLKSFEPVVGSYLNYGVHSPLTRPLSIQVNDGVIGKPLQQPAIDYSSPLLTHSFARRLNTDERASKSGRTPSTTLINETENDRHRMLLASAGLPVDERIISNPKHRQEFQVTSFEQPNPRCLHPGHGPFDVDTVRRIPAGVSSNQIAQNHQKLYQNVPFVPGASGMFCSPGQAAMRMFFDNQTLKVPAQTQTSIDGGSNNEDEAVDDITKDSKTIDADDTGVPGSPTSVRRKKTVRKDRSNPTIDKRPLSPAAQRRRLRKQSSVGNADGGEVIKIGGKTRKTSLATTSSEHVEDKNESRSSSSGQESPRKDQHRRVSVYFNNKKRPSVGSVRTARSASVDNTKDGFGTRGEALDTTNSERERTNSASSREAAGGKARKSSVSSGKVPWCACWGNGCV